MKKILFFSAFLAISLTNSLFANLESGDLRIVGFYNHSGTQAFEFLLLAPMSANEEVFFTKDWHWKNGQNQGFDNNNKFSFVASSNGIPAGTVVRIESFQSGNTSVTNPAHGTIGYQGTGFSIGDWNPFTCYKGTATSADFFISGFKWGHNNTPNFATEIAQEGFMGLDATNTFGLNTNFGGNRHGYKVDLNDAPSDLGGLINFINNTGNWKSQPGTNWYNSNITITIESTTWDGSNWSNGLPTKYHHAIISDNLSTAGLTSRNLTVNSGVSLIILEGEVLKIQGELDNQGTIELKAGAAGYAQMALPIPSISNAGQFTVEQYFGGMTGWYSISVPVEGATIASLPVSGGDIWLSGARANFFSWNAATAEWNLPTAKSEVLTPGKGYYAYMGKKTNTTFVGELPFTMSVTGTPVLTNKTVALEYNDGANSSVDFTDPNNKQGWNLLANPYPAAIDVEKMGLPNGSAIYINQQGQWVSYINGVGTNGGSRYIAPFQAFFIQAPAAQSFTFTPEMTAAQVEGNTNAPAIFKTANETNIIRASVSHSTNNVSDELAIVFNNTANLDATVGEDAFKLANDNNFPSFYSIQGQNTLSVNVRPSAEAGDTIQLGFEYATSGQMTISFDLSQFDARYDAYLVDNLTHTVQAAGQPYTFMHDENHPAGRFSLVFARNSMNVEKNIEKTVDAWVFDNNGEHTLRIASDARVAIYDMNGRSVARFDGYTGNNALPQLGSGMYIIRLDGAQTIKWVK